MQTKYVLEEFPDKKQISRFGSDGNRIVVIKVDSFNNDSELEFIIAALNYALDTFQRDYESDESSYSID